MVVIYTIAAFVAAALLFAIQPWAAKSLLPAFGGSASVWLTTLLFFQTLVVGGYGYAHLLATRAPARAFPFIHVGALLAGAALLPFTLAIPPLDVPPGLRVLTTLAAGLGVPLLIIAATTPVLHTWLSRTGRLDDEEPYFLYAASNAGSLFGLMAYPLLAEPLLPLPSQSLALSGLYAAALAAIIGCAVTARRPTEATTDDATGDDEGLPVGRWFAYAFVPTALLYGVTAYLTTDVAPVPMLWVLPLAIYLTTYILAFARTPRRLPAWFRWAAPAVIYVAAVTTVVDAFPAPTLAVHVAVFALLAMYYHGELARSKPGRAHATRFYLWSSLGGVSAGFACAVVAPWALDTHAEYPLALGLALALIPAEYEQSRSRAARVGLQMVMMGVLAAAFALTEGALTLKLGAGALLAVAFGLAMASPALSHIMLALFLGTILMWPGAAEVVEQRRSFYGAIRVERRPLGGHDYLALAHGTTTHGLQRAEDITPRRPLGYLHDEGPCGEAFADLGARVSDARVGIIGLGIGSMALYSRPGDHYTFFELDSAVVDVARTHFANLDAAAGLVEIEVVDGRLGLDARGVGQYDMIVVDAYNSDAIPVHLLTREAFAVYRRVLRPNGLLLLHTSNRFLDVEAVANASLSAAGWSARARRFNPGADRIEAFESTWLVAGANADRLSAFSEDRGWRDARAGVVWTDGSSALLEVWK